jgi:hypothetical protein
MSEDLDDSTVVAIAPVRRFLGTGADCPISKLYLVGRRTEKLLDRHHPFCGRHTDITSKAVAALIIASEHAKAEGQRAWKGVEEWLFLHRVTLERPDIACWDIERPAFVEPDLADARTPFGDHAAMAARIAAKALIVEFLVQLALSRQPRQDIGESHRLRHSNPASVPLV